jgi:hypothetical protein
VEIAILCVFLLTSVAIEKVYAYDTTAYKYVIKVLPNSGAWTDVDNVLGSPDEKLALATYSTGLLYLKFGENFSEIPSDAKITGIEIKATFYGTDKWNAKIFLDDYTLKYCTSDGLIPENNIYLDDYTVDISLLSCP